jgi:hypothetical protein
MKSGSGMQSHLKACFGDLEYTENLPKLTIGIPLRADHQVVWRQL